ncbi:uncharacterized protein Hap1MRO34_023567 [Clarias gariepinus]
MKCRYELNVDGTYRGFAQIRFDGEDLIYLYLNTSGHWTTDNAKAQRIINKWDPEAKMAEDWRRFLSSTSSGWLELFVRYRMDTEERKANHTLQYVTTITPAINFTSGELDEEQFVYYGSNVTEMILKTEWIKKINADVPDYCKSEKARMWREFEDLQYLLNQAVEVYNNTKDFFNTENKVPPADTFPRSFVITAVVTALFGLSLIASVALIIWNRMNSVSEGCL